MALIYFIIYFQLVIDQELLETSVDLEILYPLAIPVLRLVLGVMLLD